MSAQKKELKLFIWSDFARDYSGGLAFAIAENETQARRLVIQNLGYDSDDWGTLEIRPLTVRVARSVVGGG